jgi:hypothetical protein
MYNQRPAKVGEYDTLTALVTPMATYEDNDLPNTRTFTQLHWLTAIYTRKLGGAKTHPVYRSFIPK